MSTRDDTAASTGGGDGKTSASSSCAYSYDEPSTPPSQSVHWTEGLDHRPDDRMIHTLDQLKAEFRSQFLVAHEGGGGGETEGRVVAEDCPRGGIGGQQQKDERHDEQNEKIREDGRTVALWSCILGYCESLTTHKSPSKRYRIYPIPIDALSRLVEDEFLAPLNQLIGVDGVGTTTPPPRHREAARSVSDWVWGRVMGKSNVRDEQHANSLYTCLRGKLDRKSVDCFGAALCTVAGLRCLGYGSILTLSEDHAYESHVCDEDEGAGTTTTTMTSSTDDAGDASSIRQRQRRRRLATCEVAIPGNTKDARSKRGREIGETFANHSTVQQRNGISTSTRRASRLTPETSWLYMASHPVLCRDAPTTIAAAVSNVNCSIEGAGRTTTIGNGKNGGAKFLSSGPLFDLKRELLWMLKDGGHLDSFPFGLLELGDCEENRTSPRGETYVTVPRLGAAHPVLAIEALYHEAMEISRSIYDNGQVYPYCYPGHYHKDAGRRQGPGSGSSASSSGGHDEEYRLVEALRLYAEAGRVASRYVYEWGDSLQLTKVMTGLAQYICLEILSCGGGGGANGGKANGGKVNGGGPAPREWVHGDNAVAACTWVLGFYDALLLWEERTGSRFLPILTASGGHRCSIGRALALFSPDVRSNALARMIGASTNDEGAGAGGGGGEASIGTTAATIRTADVAAEDGRRPSSPTTPPVTATALQYYTTPRSRRMAPTSLLVAALRRSKVSIGDLELAITEVEAEGDGRSRRSKRARKSG